LVFVAPCGVLVSVGVVVCGLGGGGGGGGGVLFCIIFV